MKKLLIALSILSLVTFGGFLKFNKTYQSLRQSINQTFKDQQADNDVIEQNEVTYKEWMLCQISNSFTLDCLDHEFSFQFPSKISAYESGSECKEFFNYKKELDFDQPLNFNNYYKDCYLSPKALSITESNSCLKEFYDLFYIKCAGL